MTKKCDEKKADKKRRIEGVRKGVELLVYGVSWILRR